MGFGVSIFLIAIGAILAWAVSVDTNGIDLNLVGVILLIVGLLFFFSSRADEVPTQTIEVEVNAPANAS